MPAAVNNNGPAVALTPDRDCTHLHRAQRNRRRPTSPYKTRNSQLHHTEGTSGCSSVENNQSSPSLRSGLGAPLAALFSPGCGRSSRIPPPLLALWLSLPGPGAARRQGVFRYDLLLFWFMVKIFHPPGQFDFTERARQGRRLQGEKESTTGVAGRGAPVRSPSIFFRLPYKRPVSHASPERERRRRHEGGAIRAPEHMVSCCVDVQCQWAVLGRRR